MKPSQPTRLISAAIAVVLLSIAGCGSDTKKAPSKRNVPPIPRLRRLAGSIVETQGAHADSIARWLDTWGKQGAPFGHGDVAHDDTSSPAEGFTDKTMERLSTGPKKKFDQLFLSRLLEHLGAGRSIWKDEIAKGRNAQAKSSLVRYSRNRRANKLRPNRSPAS